MIESFISKTPAGWRCKWCGRNITGLYTDAFDHAISHHHIPRDHVAMDRDGGVYDLRGLSIEDWQRGGAL